MVALIDRLFAGWAPHDIMWFSACIFILLEVFILSVACGVINKMREREEDREAESPRSGNKYDFPLYDDDEIDHDWMDTISYFKTR